MDKQEEYTFYTYPLRRKLASGEEVIYMCRNKYKRRKGRPGPKTKRDYSIEELQLIRKIFIECNKQYIPTSRKLKEHNLNISDYMLKKIC